CRFPEVDRAAVATRGQPAAVWTERHRHRSRVLPLHVTHELSGVGVPELDLSRLEGLLRSAPRRGRDPAAVRTDRDAVAIRRPSGLTATPVSGPVCPRRVNRGAPVVGSQMMASPGAVPCQPPVTDTAARPSGAKAADATGWSWPRKTRISRPLAASHSRTV